MTDGEEIEGDVESRGGDMYLTQTHPTQTTVRHPSLTYYSWKFRQEKGAQILIDSELLRSTCFMWHSCLALFIARRGFEWLRHSQPPSVLNVNARPLSFQTEYYWSDEMNETLAKNVTVAMASQTA